MHAANHVTHTHNTHNTNNTRRIHVHNTHIYTHWRMHAWIDTYTTSHFLQGQHHEVAVLEWRLVEAEAQLATLEEGFGREREQLEQQVCVFEYVCWRQSCSVRFFRSKGLIKLVKVLEPSNFLSSLMCNFDMEDFAGHTRSKNCLDNYIYYIYYN